MDLAFISTTSYAIAALINSLLLALLFASWRGRLQGGLLIAAVTLTVASNAGNAFHAYSSALGITSVFILETARQGAWALFLIRLVTIRVDTSHHRANLLQRISVPATIIFYIFTTGLILSGAERSLPSGQFPPLTPLLIGAIFIIWLIEQLFRNSSPSERWAIKYLCIGVGGAVVFDTVLFIDALLFNQINPGTWAARGFVQALAAPLIAISATRNPHWEVKVFVSRSIVFFSGSLMIVGVYLLLIALAGYFLKAFGGDWGETLQATLIFAALLGLIVIMSSVQLRGQVKQFIARHFYRNKYEYRDEWLQLTQRLSDPSVSSPQQIALSAMRDLLDSPRGALWSPDNNGRWQQTCRWEWPRNDKVLTLGGGEIEQLQNQAKIIDLTPSGDQANRVFLPPALSEGQQPWLLIPLNSHGKLEGLIQLGESHSQSHQLDWEDIALVTAASHQVAAYLAFHSATNALTEARQFEAYNRLSAYLVHDLKNVVAQLQLVVQNSHKHANNPEFITDAFKTVGNAVEKMNAMLYQLRHRHASQTNETKNNTDIGALLAEVISLRNTSKPQPQLMIDAGVTLTVRCNHERMLNVILHLVQNAQEATDNNGKITIKGSLSGPDCLLEIEDTGCGITEEFIRTGLFQPFRTTKGNAGMGIGVHESKEYIESLGGSITVTSKVGTGTKFTITLPMPSTV